MSKVKMPEVMDPRFVEGTVVELEDTELRFIHLINRDIDFGGDWNVQCQVSPAAARDMKKVGFNIIEDEANGTHWVKVKKIYMTRAGNQQSPPSVVLDDGTAVTVEPGNGSKANVKLWCKYTDPIQGKVYMSAYIEKVTIMDLVEWEGAGETVKF